MDFNGRPRALQCKQMERAGTLARPWQFTAVSAPLASGPLRPGRLGDALQVRRRRGGGLSAFARLPVASGLPSARSAQAAYSAKSRGHEAHYAAHKGSRVGCDIVTVTPMHHRSDSDFALIQVWAPVYFPFGCDGPGFRCTVSDRSPGLRGTLLNPGAEAP